VATPASALASAIASLAVAAVETASDAGSRLVAIEQPGKPAILSIHRYRCPFLIRTARNCHA
jgi:hypothetical protein